MFKIIKISLLIIFLTVSLSACKALKPKWTDTRKVPVDARERALKNVKEGRGVSISGLAKNRGGGQYEFSTSNPMWRASLEILDFLPLTTVDYSGGIIITDWYNDSNSNDSIKITLRFLSNEIRADSLKVIVHRKKCSINQNCAIVKIQSKIQEELLASILKNAALIEREDKKTRILVHVLMSVILFGVVMIFKAIDKDSIIWELFKWTSFTYGPLLGLYGIGILTKRKVNDFAVPFIAVISAVSSYFLASFLGLGFEILAINGAITAIGLLVFKKGAKYELDDDILDD